MKAHVRKRETLKVSVPKIAAPVMTGVPARLRVALMTAAPVEKDLSAKEILCCLQATD